MTPVSLLRALLVAALCGVAACSDETPAEPTPRAVSAPVSPPAELQPRRRATGPDETPPQENADTTQHPPLVVHVIAEEGRAPIAGATVGVVRSQDSTDNEVRTDAEGVARLDPRPSRSVQQLLVSAPGFARRLVNVDPLADDDKPIEAVLDRAMEVTGTVTGTDGVAIAGARVDVFVVQTARSMQAWQQIDMPPIATTTSNADGRFVLDGVPKSAVHMPIVATARGRLRTMATWQKGDGPVAIRMETAASLTGTVRGPDGAPVEGAQVFFGQGDDVDDTKVPSSFWRGAGSTSAAGRYRIDGIPAGKVWSVWAQHDDFANSERRDDVAVDAETTCDLVLRELARLDVTVLAPDGTKVEPVWLDVQGPRKRGWSAQYGTHPIEVAIANPGPCRITATSLRYAPTSVDVTVAAGERRALEIRLDAGVALAGLVLDDAGGRVAGARVCAYSPDQRRGVMAELLRNATSGDDGSFRVEGLAAGEYLVQAECQGCEPARVEGVKVPTDDARIVLRRFAHVGATFRTKDGSPLPDRFWVRGVRPPGSKLAPGTADLAAWMGKTADVSAGPWSLTISVDGYVPVVRDAELAPGETRTFEGIELDPGVDLPGRVVDASGRGVEGALVVAGLRGTKTDADGNFNLEHLPRGDLDVEATRDEYVAARVRRAASATDEFVVTLRRGGVVRGTVKDAAGAPVTLGQVHFLPASGSGDHSATLDLCDDAGGFEIRLAPGEYAVTANVAGGFARGKATVKDGGETSVELVVGQ